jgi:DNA-binding SARP family transcriptional activator
LRLQTAVHAEVREVLIKMAEGMTGLGPDTAVRAACALIELDPFDEAAHVAMAKQLDNAGKRVAARRTLERYVKQLESELDEQASPRLVAALSEVRRRTSSSNSS